MWSRRLRTNAKPSFSTNDDGFSESRNYRHLGGTGTHHHVTESGYLPRHSEKTATTCGKMLHQHVVSDDLLLGRTAKSGLQYGSHIRAGHL